jgi:hypothetical protein
VRDLPRIEPQQSRAGGSRTEDAAARGDVPAARVVARRDRIADPAADVDTQSERVQQILAGNRAMVSQRQERRQHGRRRVDNGRLMRVVELEHVAGDRIHQRHVQHIEPITLADHHRLGLAGKGSQYIDQLRYGRIAPPAQARADEIQHRALGLAHHGVGNVGEAGLRNETAERRSGRLPG